jgi:hypothetical protein
VEFVAEAAPASAGPIDWAALKQQIVAGLDVSAEYEALGVRFVAQAKPDGWRPCHALGRADDVPSAAVNLATGVYHDSGGEGTTRHLFDVALEHGHHGRWLDVIRHYAGRAEVELPRTSAGKGGRIREAVHEYRAADGSVAYAVFRYRLPNGKKTFSQHPPDGKGGWKSGPGVMDGVAPVPYRLPELLAAGPSEPVWVVEGEKDADRLASLGLVATTNHQGAQATDRTWPHFLDVFRLRTVVILPDNDPGGRKHAARVAELLRGVADSVRVVALPGLPAKGDVSDWLDAGHDQVELLDLADAAPEWSPGLAAGQAEEDDPAARDATVADLRPLLSADAWCWPAWIPNAALSMLAAEPGTGKTRLCFDLARRIYHGLDWPDGAAMAEHLRGGRTLWVAADNQHQELCDIPAAYGIADEAVILNATAADPFGGTSLQAAEELADLEARIERTKPAMVIIDTITNTAEFKAESADDAKRQYKPLQEIAARQRVPILCVSHLNASGKVLGRRAKEKVRVLIQMDAPDPEQEFRRRLWVEKSRALKPAPLGVTMRDAGNDYDDAPPQEPGKRAEGNARGPLPEQAGRCMEWLATLLAEPGRLGRAKVVEIRDLAEQAGFSAKTLYKARDQLGLVESEGRPKWWSLPQPDTPEHDPAF